MTPLTNTAKLPPIYPFDLLICLKLQTSNTFPLVYYRKMHGVYTFIYRYI